MLLWYMADTAALDDFDCSPLHYAKSKNTQAFLDCSELLVAAGCHSCGPGSELPSAASPTASAAGSPTILRQGAVIATPTRTSSKQNGARLAQDSPQCGLLSSASVTTPPVESQAQHLMGPSNPFLSPVAASTVRAAQSAHKATQPNPFLAEPVRDEYDSDDERYDISEGDTADVPIPRMGDTLAASGDDSDAASILSLENVKAIDFSVDDMDLEMLPKSVV